MNRKAQIESVLNQSSPKHYKEGKEWYPNGHEYCKSLSKEFNVDIDKVCGIVSALSPMKSWPVNMRIARDFLKGKRNVHTKSQMTKAQGILDGKDIELCLGGLKTVNFYRNLLDPPDPDYVTIDRHMLWMFNERPSLSPKQYNRLKGEMKQYSLENNWIPSELQAVTWLIVKEIKHD